MNGILVVDKPAGFTSFDVVAKLRGICGTRRIGHGGTLDPMATGVLPVFVEGAAKAVDLALNQNKAYEAVVRFGIATDTGDITGQVLRQSDRQVEAAELAAVLPRFLGRQQQLPPMYSAVKINGKALYKYAREGQTVERRPREIEIYALECGGPEGENSYRLRVACGKGTYVRTLVEDIGAALGVPATLAALRRTQSGVFAIGDALPLDAIQAAKDEGRLEALYRPVEVLFETLPRLEVGQEAERRLRNGAPVYGVKGAPGRSRVFAQNRFLGLAILKEDGSLKVEKLFLEDA